VGKRGRDTPSFHRIFYVRRASIVSNFYFYFAMGQSNWLIAKTKEKEKVLICEAPATN
jgi:hypothetical protein